MEERRALPVRANHQQRGCDGARGLRAKQPGGNSTRHQLLGRLLNGSEPRLPRLYHRVKVRRSRGADTHEAL